MQTRKQHFVPQFYLQGFANERGQIWACRRDKSAKLYRTHIKNVCAIRDLYEVSLSGVSEPQYIERGATETYLSELESIFASSVKFLREHDPEDSTATAADLWEHLHITCAFISNLIIRNPHWLRLQRERAEELTRHLDSIDFFSPNDTSELKKLGYDSDPMKVVELGIQHSELFSIHENSSMAKLGEVFSNMSILLLKAPSGSEFITSSFPFTATWADTNDDEPDMIYFPLSSSSALIFKKDNAPKFFYSETSGEFVAGLNIELLAKHNLWETVIAKDRQVLDRLRGKSSCKQPIS